MLCLQDAGLIETLDRIEAEQRTWDDIFEDHGITSESQVFTIVCMGGFFGGLFRSRSDIVWILEFHRMLDEYFTGTEGYTVRSPLAQIIQVD